MPLIGDKLTAEQLHVIRQHSHDKLQEKLARIRRHECFEELKREEPIIAPFLEHESLCTHNIADKAELKLSRLQRNREMARRRSSA